MGEVSERARLLLDDHMLDGKASDDLRGCAFVSTVASSVIEDNVESSLGALFARTAVSQRALQGLLDAIESARASDDKARASQVVKSAVEDVVRCCPGQNSDVSATVNTSERSEDFSKSSYVERSEQDERRATSRQGRRRQENRGFW